MVSDKNSVQPFSSQLEAWLTSKRPKTILGLSDVFAEKSFAIAFLILMAIPALPLPTGGVSHVFEIITMLLALETIIGRHTIWLPQRWQNLRIGGVLEHKTLPLLIKYVHHLERLSKPRLDKLMGHRITLTIIGLSVLLLALTAFLAPPFSGLDTLPALGVVLLSLAILLDDFAILVLGYIAGITGIALVVGVSTVIYNLFSIVF